ncbi:MAG: ATP-binding cassette domain-containing protein [Oscillibacter sp.]|nr:ATP-binding cassette domain-containing protein [Oscillibacter sp.]
MSLTVRIKKQLGDFCLEADFTAEQETLALLGASGCGKSVTLKCIAGILQPDEGLIQLDGQTLYDSAAGVCLPPQKRGVGYLFQNYALFPNMTVRQNIAAAVTDKSRRRAVAEEKLRQFQLEPLADLKPAQLSGGQQQRTALARILASEPRAILLDEPFSALDSYLKYQMELELTEMLERFSGPILFVTHDQGEVFRACRRVCVMDQGRTQGVLTLRELFHAPGTQAAARLSGCKNLADAVPQGTKAVLPQWGLTLECDRPVPADIRCAGIRADLISPHPQEGANAVPCTVQRVIQDVFTTIVLLRPEGAAVDAPPLRMEVDRDARQTVENGSRLTVFIQSRDILLLK